MSAIVIDIGSECFKVGLSKDTSPTTFLSVIARPKSSNEDIILGGNVPHPERQAYKFTRCINRGMIENWEDFELLYQHSYNVLSLDPKSLPVFLTESNLNPLKQNQKIAELLFEKFEVPSLQSMFEGVLPLLSLGKTEGLVIHSGEGSSHFVSICEGYLMGNTYKRSNIGGKDVTKHLMNLLRKSGMALTKSGDYELAQQIKHKCCGVSKDVFDSARSPEKYTLPDGQLFELYNGQRHAGGLMFTPCRVGLSEPSIMNLFSQSLSQMDMGLRPLLLKQVVLCGGNTLMEGFPERIMREIRDKLGSDVRVRLTGEAERDKMNWRGGCVAAEAQFTSNKWITRQRFYEEGSRLMFNNR